MLTSDLVNEHFTYFPNEEATTLNLTGVGGESGRATT